MNESDENSFVSDHLHVASSDRDKLVIDKGRTALLDAVHDLQKLVKKDLSLVEGNRVAPNTEGLHVQMTSENGIKMFSFACKIRQLMSELCEDLDIHEGTRREVKKGCQLEYRRKMGIILNEVKDGKTQKHKELILDLLEKAANS